MGNFLQKNKKHFQFAAFIIGIFLALKYIFPLIVPFLLAVLLVAVIYPPIEKIYHRTHIGKGFLAGIFLLVIFSVLGSLAWFLCTWGIHKICEMIKKMDYYQIQFCSFVKDCSQMMESKIGIRADEIELIILERVDIFIEDIQVKVMPNMMNQSFFYLKVFIAVVTFIVVMIIAAILIMKDFERMKSKVIGMKGYDEIVSISQKIGRLIKTFFRAQIIILFVEAGICVAGLYFAGNKAYIALGLLTGFLDVLPFVGTGIILLPYMIWQYIQGKALSGTILLVTFCVSAMARELLEPKLIGDKMNVLPILILVSVYAGVQVFGILGVFLGPLYVLIVSECAKKIYGLREDNETAQN